MQVAACARAPVRVWKKREKERKEASDRDRRAQKKKGRAEDLNRKRLPRLNGWLIAGLAPDVCPAA